MPISMRLSWIMFPPRRSSRGPYCAVPIGARHERLGRIQLADCDRVPIEGGRRGIVH
jgi:hypothetical protein